MVTPDLVQAAYDALASGEEERIARYWAQDMRWMVPGHHQLAGWYEGRAGFLGFMAEVGRLSGGSFAMKPIAVLTGEGYSADVTHNEGRRAGSPEGSTSPYDFLNIDVVHVLKWRDGQVVEGRGAIFGDGTARFDQFWSQLDADGIRHDA
ncbi:nuclear transport factor 2 family protein [Nonomuraea sp. LPB2021202275-12-8]|uniref:nuclear transport factor 2 family protein n=1 Tax=Nonomuraea sp. LPB2021202275-12-8 TaxID=3120159 RepID=UPI00300CF5D5